MIARRQRRRQEGEAPDALLPHGSAEGQLLFAALRRQLALGTAGREVERADGLPVVSYYDWGNDDLKVAKCTESACSSAILSTVDSEGDVGGVTSITLGADGLPVISYRDDTNIDLKVARCGSAFCVPYLRRR